MLSEQQMRFVLAMRDQASSVMRGFSDTLRSAGQTAQTFKDHMGQLDNQAGRTADAIRRAKTQIDQLKQSMATIGATMSVAFTVPMALLGRDLVDVNARFRQTFINMSAFSGQAESALVGLREQSLELSKTTIFNPTQIAEAQLTLVRFGQTLSQTQATVQAASNLASIENLDPNGVAEVIGTALNQYGLAADQANRVADSIASAANMSAASIETIAGSLKYVGATARAAGVDFEETSAALVLLSQSGLDGFTAGTSLRSVFTDLIAPSMKARQEMALYDLQLRNTDGTLKDLGALIDEFVNKGVTQSSLFRIFDANSANAFMMMMAQGSDMLRDTEARIRSNSGLTMRLAEQIGQGLQGQLSNLGGAYERLLIQIGDSGFVGAFAKAVDAVTRFLDGLSDLQAQTILYGTILLGVMAILGPFIMMIGQTIEFVGALGATILASRAAWAVIAIGAAAWLANSDAMARWAENAPMAATALGALVGAVTALTAALAVQKFMAWINTIGLATRAMGLLNAVMALNPAVWLAMVIGAVVGGMVMWARATDTAAQEMRRLNDVQNEMVRIGNDLAEVEDRAIQRRINAARAAIAAGMAERSLLQTRLAAEEQASRAPVLGGRAGDMQSGQEVARQARNAATREMLNASTRASLAAGEALGNLEAERQRRLEAGRAPAAGARTVYTPPPGGAPVDGAGGSGNSADNIQKQIDRYNASLREQAEALSTTRIQQQMLQAARTAELDTGSMTQGQLRQELEARGMLAPIMELQAAQAAARIRDLGLETQATQERARIADMDSTARQIETAVLEERLRIARENNMEDLRTVQISPELRAAIEGNARASAQAAARQGSILAGMRRGIDDWAAKAGKVGEQAAQWMGQSLDTISGAFADFFTGQEVNWRDMARQIIAQIAKIIIQMLIMKAVMASLNFFGIPTPMAQGGVTPNANGNVFGTAEKFAKGGQFTNSVVSQPTLFKFAKGGKIGLMGEAGPEGILPLKRMRNGALGVQTDGGMAGAGGNVFAPVIQITVEGSSGNAAMDQDMAKMVADQVKQAVTAMYADMQRKQMLNGRRLGATG